MSRHTRSPHPALSSRVSHCRRSPPSSVWTQNESISPQNKSLAPYRLSAAGWRINEGAIVTQVSSLTHRTNLTLWTVLATHRPRSLALNRATSVTAAAGSHLLLCCDYQWQRERQCLISGVRALEWLGRPCSVHRPVCSKVRGGNRGWSE